MRKYKNKKANHNAYAYVIGSRRENIYKTDNGEARHISGNTILENIIEKNLTNIIVLVHRYYNPIYNLPEDWIKNGYATITRIILTSAQLEKINEQIKIGILLRPLNKVFLRELLDKNKINIRLLHYLLKIANICKKDTNRKKYTLLIRFLRDKFFTHNIFMNNNNFHYFTIENG
ncbi:YigZ family protein [Spiroplasma poulsonii]|nr:YigZ family protein [Spiroplasma poulsonii]